MNSKSVIRLAFVALALSCGFGAATASAQTTPLQPTQEPTAQPPDPEPAPAPQIDPRFDSPHALGATFRAAITLLTETGTTAETRSRAIEELAHIFNFDVAQETVIRDSAGRLVEIGSRLRPLDDAGVPDAAQVTAQSLTQFNWFPYPSEYMSFSHRLVERRVLDRFPSAQIAAVRGEDGTWSLTPETVDDLEEFLDAIRDMDVVREAGIDATRLSSALWLENKLRVPDSMKTQWLGVKVWKLAGLLVLIVLGLTVDLFVRTIIVSILRRMGRRHNSDLERRTVRRFVRPFGLVFAAVVFVVGIRFLGLPELALLILQTAARVFLTFSAVLAAYRLTDLIAEFVMRKADNTHTRIDDLLVPLLRKSAKLFIAALGAIYLANALSIEILPLLTGLGIGGIAVAFAAKDTIENFFGSIAVIADRPFDVGDWVVMGDVEGTVETMGLRSTRIRTFYNSIITVPNASLVRANVDNYGKRKYRRLRTHIAVTYDTPPDSIEAFCEGIRELIRQHPYTRKDYYNVWLHEMGSASLDILLYVFHEAPDWTTELRERQRLILDIIRLANALEVSFAFPTQTLYMREEKDWSHPLDPEGLDKESKAIQAGKVAARQVVRLRDWRSETPEAYEFTGAGAIEEAAPEEGEEGSAIEDRTAGA